MKKQKDDLNFEIIVRVKNKDGEVINEAISTESIACKPTVFKKVEEFRPYLDKTEEMIIKGESMMQDTILGAITKQLSSDKYNKKK